MNGKPEPEEDDDDDEELEDFELGKSPIDNPLNFTNVAATNMARYGQRCWCRCNGN